MRTRHWVIGAIGVSLATAQGAGGSSLPATMSAPSATASPEMGGGKPVLTPQRNKYSPPASNCKPDRRDPCNKFRARPCSTSGVYYGWPAYYLSYDLPVSSYAEPVGYVYGGTYTFSNGTTAWESTATSKPAARQEKSFEQDYREFGRDWGQDLRRDVVTFDQFIAFVAERIVDAPEVLRHRFREGFETGYGQHAYEAFHKALAAAQRGSRDGSSSGH